MKDGFSNLSKKIERVEKTLHEVHQQATSATNCKKCVELEKELDALNAKQEAYWFMQSDRVAEVKDGDRNTSYFHHKASQAKSQIISKAFVTVRAIGKPKQRILRKKWSCISIPFFSSMDPRAVCLHEVLQNVKAAVTVEYNNILLKPYTKEEIFEALNQMHPCKTPGQNAMHTIFHQRFWHIIGDEVFDFNSNILHKFSCLGDVNCTNIALIPKVKSPLWCLSLSRLVSVMY